MSEEKKTLNQVLAFSQKISLIKDLDVLLESILTEARRMTRSDAGSIYLRHAGMLQFSYTQNDAINRRLPPGRKMIYSTFSIPVGGRSLAGHVASTGSMLNIPDAYALPSDAPCCFDRSFDEASGYRSKSILTFPVRAHMGDVTGVLQLINAMDESGSIVPFGKGDELLAEHFASAAAVAIERARITRAIILRMINMAALRDPKETGPHVNRVASYAVEIYDEWARLRGLDPATVQRERDSLRMGAMLHDVGKIAISDAILKKPTRLTPEETLAMQAHTLQGARLFHEKFSDFDEASYSIALDHHEKWDGTGYPGFVDPVALTPLRGHAGPGGKRGEEIHPFGRLVAIADVYDALSSRRVYKEAWDEGRVLDTLRQDAGTHFDPEMIEAFFSVLEAIRSLSARYPEAN
jgi:HD-GYP domain-containing protein (c-di-GMP phosphodiesterase class II)